jgi:hypothetical protein
MTVSADKLYEELRALCKGLGVQHPRLRDRIGPALKEVAGITDTPSNDDARTKLVGKLRSVYMALPANPKLRLAESARVALAMDDTSESALLALGERQGLAAELWGCDIKTVRRHCDHALQLMSTILAKQTYVDYASDQWHLESLKVFLRLDKATPEAREERTVVSNVPNLTHLGNATVLPRHPRERKPLDLEVEFEYGARWVETGRPTADYFMHYVELPTALQPGDRHTYSRIVRIPAGQRMVPRYAFGPLHRCDAFELRVKFHPDAPPRLAWVLAGVPEAIYRINKPGSETREPNDLGEIYLSFENLHVGLGYGLAWQPA